MISSSESLAQQPTEEEVRAFVGSNANYYLKKWESALHGGEPDNGFNWAAFFLAGLWIPYRKMYRITLIFYGAAVVFGLLTTFVFSKLSSLAGDVIRISGDFVACFVCGEFANSWYLAHARKVITKVRAQGLPAEEALHVLAKRGGKHRAAALVVLVLLLVVLVIVLVSP